MRPPRPARTCACAAGRRCSGRVRRSARNHRSRRLGFDEFERALEGFRRSVSRPVQRSASDTVVRGSDPVGKRRRGYEPRPLDEAHAGGGGYVIVIFGGVACASYSFLARDGGIPASPPASRRSSSPTRTVKVRNPGGRPSRTRTRPSAGSVGGAAAEASSEIAGFSDDAQSMSFSAR